MEKSQSFHIIIRGFVTQKGDFIGFDLYSNSVFISKKIKKINNFKEISEDTPIYCIVEEELIFKKNADGRKIHFLNASIAESELINIINKISDDIRPEIDGSEKVLFNFKLIKSIFTEHKKYTENKEIKNNNNYGFNRSIDEENYELPFLLLSTSCIDLKQKLDRYILYYGYEKEIDFEEIIRGEKSLGLENKKNDVFKIDRWPLYSSLKIIYHSFNKTKEKPTYKLITKNELLNFDRAKQWYFNQFYEFYLDGKSGKSEYLLGCDLEFKERLKTKFKTMFVYVITPMVPESIYNNSNFDFGKAHNQLIELVEYLEKEDILNVIIIPPDYTYYEASLDIHYYLYPPKEIEHDYTEGWLELGKQEMKKWDEETDGSWKIENDFD